MATKRGVCVGGGDGPLGACGGAIGTGGLSAMDLEPNSKLKKMLRQNDANPKLKKPGM